MAYFEVIVQYANGKPAKGIKIANGYSRGHEYTGADGKVLFDLNTTKTELYIDGRKHSEMTPGTTLVPLSR